MDSYPENVYLLIPRDSESPEKSKRYKSKFPHNVPPTGSTFCHITTSVPKVWNLGGEYSLLQNPHSNISQSAHFGKVKEAYLPSPSEFTRKNVGLSLPKLSQSVVYKASCLNEEKKPRIPTVNESPILGLRTSKNYIVSNAIANILSTPKAEVQLANQFKHENYGKIPEYIVEKKETLNREFTEQQKRKLKESKEKEKEVYALSHEELNNLRDALKTKWEIMNKEYQKFSHLTKFDTVGKKRRKLELERELAGLERDMEKLKKEYIFIDTRKNI